MKEKIKDILIKDYGYGDKVADTTAQDLCDVKYEDISRLIERWISTREEGALCERNYSIAKLMNDYSMKYPAALLFIVWLRDDPAEAVNALSYMG